MFAHSFQLSPNASPEDGGGGILPHQPQEEQTRARLIRETLSFWNNLGLTILPRVPLISRPAGNGAGKATDESVLFVGSNTNIVKDLILTGSLPANGLCTSQPKLRLQNYRALFTDDAISYASYFHSFGITSAQSGYEGLTAQLDAYFRDVLGLSPDRVVVTTFGEDHLVLPWGRRNYRINIDGRSERFDWDFGVAGHAGAPQLTGRGIYFELAKADGTLTGDFASLEQIVDTSRGPVAYEFGMGYETYLARTSAARGKESHPLAFSCLGSLVQTPGVPPHVLKAADCLLVVLSILNEGMGPSKTDFSTKATYSFFRRFLRGVLFYMGEVALERAQLEGLIDEACATEFMNISAQKRGQLVDTVSEYREKQDFFRHAVEALLRGEIATGTFTLPSVRRHFRNKTPLDIPGIAAEYGLVEFEQTALYRRISPQLSDGRFLQTASFSG